MAHKIFISYRIADTLDQAGRLHQSLENHFGAGSTFYDKSSMKAGMRWPSELEEKLQVSKVVLVLYRKAKEWLGVDEYGSRRVDDIDDWVRREIALAFESGKIVIPVLFGQDTLPPAHRLPESLQKLRDCQHHTIRSEAWEPDLAPLLIELEKDIPRASQQQALSPPDLLEDFPLPKDISLPRLPYKGLSWFEETDTRIFFGREREIIDLFGTRLSSSDTRVVLFYGQSGAGKSSFLHAGLTPRLKSKGWLPTYLRRTRDGAATDIIRGYLPILSGLPIDANPLLIVDQLEEMFTHPLDGMTLRQEQEAFPGLLIQLLSTHTELRILLGFREDYLAAVKELLQDVKYSERRLNVMDRDGLRRAVAAIPDGPLKHEYKDLSFTAGEENLPVRIADDLYASDESRSNAAPLLQYVLRKMWDEQQGKDKVVFSWKLYEQHRRRSAVELLQTQLQTLRERHGDELQSGLVLDLLSEFVTPDSTAGQQSVDSLQQHYNHLPSGRLITLCQSLHSCYLLSETAVDQQQGYRLAHDALAPAVVKLFTESLAPGQRARLILESKLRPGIEHLRGDDILLSQIDLDIIRQGREGMYALPKDWQHALEKAERHYQSEREKDEQQRIHIASFYLRKAENYLDSLNHVKAYESVVEALRTRCFYTELRKVLIEIAFVQAEGSNRVLVFDCLASLAETGCPVDVENLNTLQGIFFTRGVHNQLISIDENLFKFLYSRYYYDMVEVEGGEFMMGEDNKTHPAAVSTFFMARTPVTWKQFYIYHIATQEPLPESPSWGRLADNPVVNVSWYDAVAYANWLSVRMELEPVYNIDTENRDESNENSNYRIKWAITIRLNTRGYRLPTETEWEYAARGGQKGAKDNFKYSGSDNADDVAWHGGNCASPEGIRRTREVYDTKQPNQLGLFHMSGNVNEWCWDWRGEYPKKLVKDYIGPRKGSDRVFRGGSWAGRSVNCRVALRGRDSPDYRDHFVGFRLVFVP